MQLKSSYLSPKSDIRVSQTRVLQKFCWLSRDLKDQQLACIRLYSHSLPGVKWKLKGTLTNIPHIHKVLILSQQGHMTEVTITVHDCCSHTAFSKSLISLKQLIYLSPAWTKSRERISQIPLWLVRVDNTPGKMDFHFLIKLLD